MAIYPESIDSYVDAVVKGKAPEFEMPLQEAVAARKVEPCSIVVFGATGDLTHRKLAPRPVQSLSPRDFLRVFRNLGSSPFRFD